MKLMLIEFEGRGINWTNFNPDLKMRKELNMD